ncbi:MAG: DUF262 domain-containing protein [Planctomycetaceae bacterium]|nr:DUF262 domain-containing protein [Planctomycetaceae bacterium]
MPRTVKKHPVVAMNSPRIAAAELQIRQIQRDIRFDTRDFPVETIVNRFHADSFFIPPYQREFVWNESEQSQFIESVFMGLPIPMMFLAEDADGTFEIVDGAQRIQTLAAFLDDDLKLRDLKQLTKLNGFIFSEVPESQRNKFVSRALRLVILDQETSDENRRELFNRINKSGRVLTPSERRRGALEGKFMRFLETCSKNRKFISLCPVSKGMAKRKEPLELVTRFFAYSERYQEFIHNVDGFLDAFVKDHRTSFPQARFTSEFKKMLDFVGKFFPYGFAKSPTAKTTPRVRFEALSVGVNLALREDRGLIPSPVVEWIESEAFKLQTTTHASNSPIRLANRIEYVRDCLLGNL